MPGMTHDHQFITIYYIIPTEVPTVFSTRTRKTWTKHKPQASCIFMHFSQQLDVVTCCDILHLVHATPIDVGIKGSRIVQIVMPRNQMYMDVWGDLIYPKDHWTLQWKGLNLYSRGRALKIAAFEGSGYLGYIKFTNFSVHLKVDL